MTEFGSTRQVALRFTPASGKQPLFGSDWRQLVAKRLQGAALDPEQACLLFHHTAQGRTQDGKPSICFTASPSWVGVVATGEAACAVLAARLLDLVMAAQAGLGPCAVEHHDQVLGLDFDPARRSYRVRSFVGNRLDREMSPERVRRKLTTALNSWAQRHGICAQADEPFDIKDVVLERLDRQSPLYEPCANGATARTRMAMTFHMPWRLHGNWFVGSHCSKGHGFVQYAMAHATGEGAGRHALEDALA